MEEKPSFWKKAALWISGRGFYAVLALCLVLSACVCAQADTVGTTEIPDLSGVELHLLSMESYASGVTFADILPVYRVIEEMTGVKLYWEVANTDYNTVLQTKLVSGENLDIVSCGSNNDLSFVSKLCADKNFVDINLYMDELPGIKAYMEARPDVAASLTYYNGAKYVLPCATYNTQEGADKALANSGDNIMIYRGDLAEELGFDEIYTIDDLHAYLLACKEAYPEMIPMLVRDWTTWCSVYVFSGSYGLHFCNPDSGSDYFYPDENGDIVFEPLTDACKEFVTEMATWYSEGLFGFSSDRQALCATNQVCAAWFTTDSGRQTVNKLLVENGYEGAYFKDMHWLTGPEGKKGIGRRVPFITTIGIVDNENAEAALKFVDFTFFSDFGRACMTFGAYGINWDYDENGMPRMNDETVQAYYIDQTTSATAQGGGVHTRMPRITDYDYEQIATEQSNAAYIAAGTYQPVSEESLACYAEWLDACYPSFPFMFYNEEETEIYNGMYPDIKTRVQEMLSRFITGEEPLDNWDAFVAEIKEMGIDKVVGAVQSAYDRR